MRISLCRVNWITVSWPMAIAACLTLAAVHGQIARRMAGRLRRAHLYFTLCAVAVAVTGSIELTLLHTQSLATYQYLMRWAQVPIWLMVLSLAGFTGAFFGTGRSRLAVASASLMTVVLGLNMVLPAPLTIRYTAALHPVVTWGGVPITLAHLEPGLLTWGELAAVLLLFVFVLRTAAAAWRQGDRRRAVIIGACITIFLMGSRVYALLVETGLLQTPYFFIFHFLVLLVGMGRELSLDVFRAAQLTDELRESEERMALAARAAGLGFWLWDMARDDLWASPDARALFGVPADEPLNFDRFLAVVHPADRAEVRRGVAQARANGRDLALRYRITPVEGQRWIAALGRLEPGPDGALTRMRGVVIDVTERRRAQEEVERMRKELAHVTRVSTLGELAASMAHELNQPLAAILSNAQAARRFLAAPEADLDEIRAILDDIIKDDKRAGEVIHRLRALVQKREAVETERLNLNELVRDAERLLHGELVARNTQLVEQLQPDLGPAVGGRVELQQVLLNLLVNALDAMRDVPVSERAVTVETASADGWVELRVCDAGPGIPESLLPEIFRPFFTTKQHGLGMGLAISRSILEACGGTLTAANRPGGGAQFTLRLPAPGT